MSGDGERAYVERSAAISALLLLIALLGCAGTGALGGYDYELQKGFEAEQEDDFARALDHYEAAADLAREREMPSHSLAMALADVARSALYLGDLERAGEEAQRAIEIYASDPPPFDPATYQAGVLATLGRVHLARREFSRGAELLEQSLRINDVDGVRHDLVWAYWELGDVDRAIVEQMRLLERMETYALTGLPTDAVAHNSLGVIYCYRGNYDACALEYQTALTQGREWYEPDDPELTILLSNLAGCLLELGRYEEAESLLEEALSILENPDASRARARFRSKALAYLALLRARQGRVEEARKALEGARAEQEAWFATEPGGREFREDARREVSAAELVRVEANLAAAEGRRSDAIASYERSLQLYEKRFGANSPHLRLILDDYLGALQAAGEGPRAADVERRLAAISAQAGEAGAP